MYDLAIDITIIKMAHRVNNKYKSFKITSISTDNFLVANINFYKYISVYK